MSEERGETTESESVEYGLEDWAEDANEEESRDASTLVSTFGGDDPTGRLSTGDGGPSTLAVVLGGGFVGALLAVPFPMIGTVIGGSIAGWLKADDGTSGAKLGAAAGFVSTIPGALFGVFTGDIPSLVLEAAGGDGGAALGVLIGLFSLLVLDAFGALLGAALGAAGGYAGAEFGDDLAGSFGGRDRSD